MQRHIEQADIHIAAFTAGARIEQRREQTHHCRHAGHVVDHRRSTEA